MTKLLKKGLEVELYAGTSDGQVLPLSSKILEHFPNFSQEPDERNVEYITSPIIDYNELFKEILEPRLKLRKYLKENGDFTLIPGSTIALPFEKKFYPTKPGDKYHQLVWDTYKTSVVTTSLHINFGIEDTNTLFKLLSALRLDAPLLLALSASSCFYDGNVTDFNSYRWHSFPHTPSFVPFFADHNDYVLWTNEQLANKKMFNVRHLWTSIRPNGNNRPYDLNRIEVRICDFVSDITKTLSIVAFIECLIHKYLIEDKWPLVLNTTKNDLDSIVTRLKEQEELVSKAGLNANIWDWRNNTTNKAAHIIEFLFKDLESIAKELNILNYLLPITDILTNGNEAMCFLNQYKKNNSVQKTMEYMIEEFTNSDLKAQDLIENKIKANI